MLCIGLLSVVFVHAEEWVEVPFIIIEVKWDVTIFLQQALPLSRKQL
jgi:hypothetical protein